MLLTLCFSRRKLKEDLKITSSAIFVKSIMLSVPPFTSVKEEQLSKIVVSEQREIVGSLCQQIGVFLTKAFCGGGCPLDLCGLTSCSLQT